jgi:hypothetical protein
MTPEQIEQWYREHGGKASEPTTDANGVTAHRAADGSFINVRRDGSLAMQGGGAPAEGAAPVASPPASTAPASGGGGMNQQQVEQWIAQNGGPGAVQYTSEKQRVPNPAFSMTLPDGSVNPQYQPGQPPTVEVVSEAWINSKTGATLRVGRRDDGSFDVLENKSADPSKAQNEDTPEKRNAAELQRQRERNAALPPDQDPAYETDADRRKRAEDRIAQQGRDAEAERTRKRQEAADARAGGTIVERPDGSYIIKPDGTATKVQGVPPPDAPKGTLVEREDGTYLVSADGKNATKVTGLPPKAQDRYTEVKQDPDSKEWWGFTREGTWERIPGGPGAQQAGPQSRGPAVPQFILGQSEAALRAYADQLNAEVAAGRMTPATRKARWDEAVQAAGIAVNEATLMQRERESDRNAQVNLATTRATAMSNGLNQALDFVSKLNGTLPKGSPLGGQAFAAILGLQMLQLKQSGLMDIPSTGGDPRSIAARQIDSATRTATAPGQIARPAPLTDPNNRAAVEAQREQVAAQLAAPPVTQADGNEKPDDILSVRNDNGEVRTVTRGAWNEQTQRNPYLLTQTQVVNAESADAYAARSGGWRAPASGLTDAAPAPTAPPPTAPAPVPTVNPQTGEPTGLPQAPAPPAPAPDPAAPVQMAPAEQFPVLASFNQSRPAQPPAFTPQQPSGPMPPAILQTKAATTPPWRLRPDEIEEMRAAGVPDDLIWSTPGRVA